MVPVWQIEMLGTLQAKSESVTVSRFRTRRVGLLLAYLALFPNRNHSREELAYLLWPEEEDDEIARRNLRQALSSLRRHLEPPPLPKGSVLIAKQASVRLNMEVVSSDVGGFERLLTRANQADSEEEKMRALEEAAALYKGSLLPGHYEDWIETERERLDNAHVHCLKAAAALGEHLGRTDKAIGYLRLALGQEPLDEELSTSIIRLYLESGRPASALKQYRELERVLKAELHCSPGEEARALARRAKSEGGGAPPKRVPQPVRERTTEASSGPKNQGPQKVNLPIKLTRFHGRVAELGEALKKLRDPSVRLVSLVGPAGVGKSRLSIETAKVLAQTDGWNVWFVALANIETAAILLDAVMDAMRIRGGENRSPLDQIQASIRGDRNLFVLDNLEHLMDDAAPIVADLVRAVEGAKFLTTSRHSLKIEGEHETILHPLPVPALDDSGADSTNLAALSGYPSIQLFVDRCQAIHPDYQLTASNAQTISAICDRLEGLPLALEIAAGLSNAFTAAQLLQNLESKLAILKNRYRDAEPRHRSLRAAIDYSYELLPEDLQNFFASLSVFRGGFNVSAAAAVCTQGPTGERETETGVRRRRDSCLGLLLSLQERSLIQADESGEGNEARYRMFESFREYGRERLSQADEELLLERHAEYYLRLGLDTRDDRIEDLERAAIIRLERDNMLAATSTFIERENLEGAISILDSAMASGAMRRPNEAQVKLLRRLDEHRRLAAISAESFISLKKMLANIHIYSGEYAQACAECRSALERAKRTQSEKLLAIAHAGVAVAEGYAGNDEEALNHYTATLSFIEASPIVDLAQRTYTGIGTIRWKRHDLNGAKEAFLKARLVRRRLGRRDHWLTLYNLSRVSLDQGKLDEAMNFAGESLRAATVVQDQFGISMSLSMMSRYHWLKHNLDEALSVSRDALRLRRDLGFKYWLFNAIQFHGFVLADAGKAQDAAVLLAATKIGLEPSRPTDIAEFSEALVKVKHDLPEMKFESAWARGLSMSAEEAAEYALDSAC